MNEKKLIIIMVVITSLILFGGLMLVSSTSSSAPQIKSSVNAKANVTDPTSFDWGQIPMNGGKKTKTFSIKNSGTDVLKLYNVKTSCHCTKAYVTIDGNESPYFGMTGISSWTGEVNPGKEAKVTAVFDPLFHGVQGLGPIQRYVSLETNDASLGKLTFTLTGTVFKD